jgi:hypothetical protein
MVNSGILFPENVLELAQMELMVIEMKIFVDLVKATAYYVLLVQIVKNVKKKISI